MTKKPLCFNAVKAIDRIGELEKKVKHQADEIIRLKQENTDLKVQIYQMIKEKTADDELKAKG